MNNKNNINVEFLDGCFDNLNLSEEELEKLKAQLTTLAQTGELTSASSRLDDLSNFNYAETLKSAIKDVKDFKKP